MSDVVENKDDKLVEEEQAKELEQQEKLEEKVDEKMKTVFVDSTPEPEPEPKPKSTPEPEPKPEPEPDPQPKPEPEPEPEPEPKPADDGTKSEPKPAEDENTLTQAEIRAALHNNWKQEDLDELVKQNPGLAKRTCAKLLEGTNNLSKRFAELGRKAQEAKKEPDKKVEPKAKIELPPVDLKKLREDYKDDPIVDVVVGMQTTQQILIDKLNELGSTSVTDSEVDAKTKKAEAIEDAAISKQIDVFFSGQDVASYAGFYGEVPKGSKDWNKLTGEQVQNRYKVVEEANMILLGAEQQGMDKDEFTLDEALERAHLIVTEGIREQVIRNKIKSTTTKRQAGFTLQPSSSKASTDSKGQKSGTQFQTDVGQRLAKVFSRS